ncbi:MAG: Holliday junction resolvase, partial [Methanobacteriaceae archaeon]|nr:Holliday junction resolvase [Methanobacteriaceae archaeon]
QKIDALLEFSNIFGAQPYLGAKFIREKWRFVRPKDLFKTKQENYRLDKELAFSKGLEFDELLGRGKQVKF